MTETARTYAIVLYELGIPEDMVREAVKLLKENPELPEVLNSPVVPLKSKHAVIEKVFREPEFSALMVRFLKKACDAGCIGQTEEIAAARDAYGGRCYGCRASLCYHAGCGPDYRNETVSVQEI